METNWPDPRCFTPSDEIAEVLGCAIPNTNRTGCRSIEMLQALAKRQRPISEPWYQHLLVCSPCYCAVRVLQRADGGTREPAPARARPVVTGQCSKSKGQRAASECEGSSCYTRWQTQVSRRPALSRPDAPVVLDRTEKTETIALTGTESLRVVRHHAIKGRSFDPRHPMKPSSHDFPSSPLPQNRTAHGYVKHASASIRISNGMLYCP